MIGEFRCLPPNWPPPNWPCHRIPYRIALKVDHGRQKRNTRIQIVIPLDNGNATLVTDTSDIQRKYEYWMPLCTRLRKDAVGILNDALVRESIKIDSVTGRVKSLQSLLDKMKRTGKTFEQVNDLLGLRVVCLFRSQIKDIAQTAGKEFQVLPGLVDDKFESKDIDRFGYLDLKLIAKLRPEYVGGWIGRVALKDFLFEIQIRTVGMHAWATVSHYLDYKLPTQVPRDLRRDFQALSALFHVADSQFEAFFAANQTRANLTGEPPSSPDLYSELDLESLFAYLQMRFPDRISETASGTVSQFLLELTEAGIYRLNEIEVAVNRWLPAILEREKIDPPTTHGDLKGLYTAVGLARIAVASQFEHFAKNVAVVRFRS